jgi:hypothetical protein
MTDEIMTVEGEDILNLTEETEQQQAVVDSEEEGVESDIADLSFLEESDNADSITNDSKEDAREKTLQGQIKAAQKKIDEGKASFEDFPSYIKEKLDGESKPVKDSKKTEKVKALDEEAIVKRAMQRIKEEQTFESLRSQVQSLELDSEKASLLKAEFTGLKKEGVANTKALETAIRLVGLGEEVASAEQRGLKMGLMGIKPSGKHQTMKKQEQNIEKMSDDDFMNWSDNLGKKQKIVYKV